MRGRSLCLAASGLIAAASWSACKSAEQPKPADDGRVQTLEEQLQAAKQDAAATRAVLDETNARLERLAKERDEQAALLTQQEKERAERAQQQDDRARDQARRLEVLEHALAQHPHEPKPQEQGKPHEQAKAEPVLAVAHRSQDDGPVADQLRQLREQLQSLREQLQQELRARGQAGALRNCTPSRQSVDRHGTPTRTEMTRRETPAETGTGRKVID
jgi:DNA repair exonuclease SbcCD ATPase subunit